MNIFHHKVELLSLFSNRIPAEHFCFIGKGISYKKIAYTQPGIGDFLLLCIPLLFLFLLRYNDSCDHDNRSNSDHYSNNQTCI